MPYKFEETKEKIRPEDDRRIKLSDEDKDLLHVLHKAGESIHSLSRRFKVSRRLIQFILYPDRHKENLAKRKERGGSKQYYDRKKNTVAIRKYRRHKQELKLLGKLQNG